MSTVLRRTPFLNLNIIDFGQPGWHVPEHENMYILDAMVNQFATYTGVQGIWLNSTSYVPGNTVIDTTDSSIWECVVGHTSAAVNDFGADRVANPGRWTLVLGGASDSQESPFVTPEDFQAVGDGVADDSTSIENMIVYAMANGKSMRLDNKYRITRPLTFTLTANLIMEGKGELIADNLATDATMLYLKVAAGAVHNVVSVANTTYDYSNGEPSAVSTPVTRIELNTGHGVVATQVCKLISNDVLTQQSPDARYRGEVVFIGAVGGNYLYTTGEIFDAYTTSPRLIVYNTAIKVSISGLTFKNLLSDALADNKNHLLKLEGAFFPRLANLKFQNISGSGFFPIGCVFVNGTNLLFQNGINQVGSGTKTGYGIQESCGSHSIYMGLHGINMRHTFTTIALTTDTSNVFTYGEPVGHMVANSVDFGASGGGFDTHSASRGIAFMNIVTGSPFVGENASRAGIQLRGGFHFVCNHSHVGSGHGVVVAQDYAGEYGNHHLSSLKYKGTDRALYISPNTGYVRVNVDGLHAESSANGVIWLEDCKVYLRNLNLITRGAGSVPLIYLKDNVYLDAQDPRNIFDLTHAPSTAYRICTYDGVNTILISGKVAGSVVWDSVVRGNSTPGNSTIDFSIDADIAPSQTHGYTNTASSSVRAHVSTGRNAASPTASQTVALASGANALSFNNSGAPAIIVECTVAGTGRQVTSLAAGKFIGQQLIIVNSHNNANTLEIVNNHTNLIDTGANVTVSPASAFMFVWDGSVWKGISAAVSVTGSPGVTDHGALTGLADDDHTQYHNATRALTWLNGRTIADLGDVPALGTAGQVLAVNAGATALEYVARVDTKIAALNLLLDALYFFASNSGEPELRIKNSGAATKHAFTHTHAVIGGDLSERVSSEVLTVVGDVRLKSGGIVSDTYAADYTKPALIGAIRIWDDGAGKLRAKSGSDPANATDGTVLW